MTKKFILKPTHCLIFILAVIFIFIIIYNPKEIEKRHLAIRRGSTVVNGLRAHYVGCGKYPTTEQGLEALVTKNCGSYKRSNYTLKVLETEKFTYESDGQTFILQHPIRNDVYWTEEGLIEREWLDRK